MCMPDSLLRSDELEIKNYELEGVADGKVESHVIAPTQSVGGCTPLRSCQVTAEAARVVNLDAEVHSEQQYIEVQSQAHTIGKGYLLVKLIPLEHAVGLYIVLAYRPVVTGINERREFDD